MRLALQRVLIGTVLVTGATGCQSAEPTNTEIRAAFEQRRGTFNGASAPLRSGRQENTS